MSKKELSPMREAKKERGMPLAKHAKYEKQEMAAMKKCKGKRHPKK